MGNGRETADGEVGGESERGLEREMRARAEGGRGGKRFIVWSHNCCY